jgi:hypothetical protein
VLQIGTICALLLVVLLGCDMNRDSIVKQQKKRVNASIKIGDDIFLAKDKLVKQGFTIEYGPDFPTKSRDYLIMNVDYGVRSNGLETFKYTVGMEGSGELISGVIKADPTGKITSIE